MKKYAIVALMLIGAAGMVQAAGSVNDGKAKSAVCTACHNADGNSSIAIYPKIAGQHASYTAKQLADFKSGARPNAIMLGMTAGLTEQDMADLAAYFASHKTTVGSASGDVAEAGRAIYLGGVKEKGLAACMACHGPSGKGNPGALFPSLSGQHPAYTVATLKEYRAGTRKNVMMNDIAAKMSDSEIDAVAEYIHALH
jgi:cytochrome c553